MQTFAGTALTEADIIERLRASGLRPTRQRVSLGRLLFEKGARHISAEALHEEAMSARIHVSLATVYNTLNQFSEAGLLREVSVDATRTYFDTNATDHHHFFVEGENRLIDIDGKVELGALPEPPSGMEITSVEVVVKVRPIRN